MSIIDVSNLTFAYDGSYDNIFDNVSFRIDTDWKLGFVGRNGRGKTTFLNLLLGKYKYSGTISCSVDFDYFPFEVLDTSQYAIDIIKEKASILDCDYWKIQKELSLIGLSEDVLYRQFNTLSGGERIKVLLVALFLKEHCFILMDEPTNHLDINSREKVCRYLNSKNSFILVSHDRSFLDNCVDHILSINKTNIEIHKGNFSSWYKNKQMQDELELSKNDKLKKDIRRLQESAKQTSEWSHQAESSKHGTKNSGLRPDRGYIGHKAAKVMKRSKSLQSRKDTLVDEKSKLLTNIENAETLKLTCKKHPSEKLLEFKNVSLFYANKKICDNISFDVCPGDRIAICGNNGCGKSTLLKLTLGYEKINYTGEFRKASNLEISYVSQDTSTLTGNLTDFAMENHIDESLFKTILRKLDFSRTQFEKNIDSFSGGQKKKVLIAKSLCEHANIYIWDEPLNFIDIQSRIQIEDLILRFKPTILFVEHDVEFIKNISTKIFNMA